MEVGQFVERGQVVFSKKIARGPKIGSDLTVTLKTPLALLVLGGTAGAVKWEQKTVDRALSSLGLFLFGRHCRSHWRRTLQKIDYTH